MLWSDYSLKELNWRREEMKVFPGNPFILLKSLILLVLCLSKTLVKISLPQFKTAAVCLNAVMTENESILQYFQREQSMLLSWAEFKENRLQIIYTLIHQISHYKAALIC